MSEVVIEPRTGEHGAQWAAVIDGIEFLSPERALLEEVTTAYVAAVPCAGGPPQFTHVLVVRKTGKRAQMRSSGALDSKGWGVVLLTGEADDAPHEVGHLWAFAGPSALVEGRAQMLARCVGLTIGAPARYPDLSLVAGMPDLAVWHTTSDEEPDAEEHAGYSGAYALAEAIDASHGYAWPLDGRLVWKEVIAALSTSPRSDAQALAAAMTDGGPAIGRVLVDNDHDGVPDVTERATGTDPARWDSDGDGAPDRDEEVPGTLTMQGTRAYCADGPLSDRVVLGRSVYGIDALPLRVASDMPGRIVLDPDRPPSTIVRLRIGSSPHCYNGVVSVSIQGAVNPNIDAATLGAVLERETVRLADLIGGGLVPEHAFLVVGRGRAGDLELPPTAYLALQSEEGATGVVRDLLASMAMGPFADKPTYASTQRRIRDALETGTADHAAGADAALLRAPAGDVTLALTEPIAGIEPAQFRAELDRLTDVARRLFGRDVLPPRVDVVLGGERASSSAGRVALTLDEGSSIATEAVRARLAAEIVARAAIGPEYAGDLGLRARVTEAIRTGRTDGDLADVLTRLKAPSAVHLTFVSPLPGLELLATRDAIALSLSEAKFTLEDVTMPASIVVELGSSTSGVAKHVVRLTAVDCMPYASHDEAEFLFARIVAMAILANRNDQRWTEALARDLSGVNGGSWPEEADVDAIRAEVAAKGGWAAVLSEPPP